MATPHKLLGRLALAGVLAAATPALAGKRDQSVKFAYDQAPENVDPFFNNVRIGVIIGQHVWDTLVYRDPNTGEYKGQLATAWRQVDDKTLEFDLRQGVKFHDGEEFDADDVVYTLNFVSKPENKVPTQSNVNWIDRAEKVDKYKVRIFTKKVVPGGDRVSRRPGGDAPERLLRQGRAEGPEREAGRLWSVPGSEPRARQVDHARAQPRLLQGLAEGPGEGRPEDRDPLHPRPSDADGGVALRRHGLPHARAKGPGRSGQGRAESAGGQRRDDADRVPADERAGELGFPDAEEP